MSSIKVGSGLFSDFSTRPKSLFFIEISVSLSYYLRSYGETPTKFKVSQISTVFIFLSNGEELDNDGEMLTSSSHGLRFLSSKISKPKSSKHTLRCFVHLDVVLKMRGSTDINVLTITSLILCITPLKSTPTLSKYLFN
jgi:hypothetical protein